MLTQMSEDDWAIAVEVFRAVRSMAGRRGVMTASFWKRCIISPFITSPGEPSGGVWQLEQRVEAVLAAKPAGRLEALFALANLSGTAHLAQMVDSTVVRAHVWRRRKAGQENQALGRSRGGFSTKIHLKTDLEGLAVGFHLTGGEASDSRNFETLLNIGPGIAPRAVVADKGYDAAANREAARERGVCPVIPYRSKHQEEASLFRQGALQKPRADRAGIRQTQAL